MIVIRRNLFKKLEALREHLNLDDTLTSSQFLSVGTNWFLIYAGIEMGARLSLWRYGLASIFFDQLWWFPRIIFLTLISRRFYRLKPEKTIGVLAAFSGVWGFLLGAAVGLEKFILLKDLANFFTFVGESLSLFVLGSLIGFLVYRPPLSLLYKHKINEEN